MNLIEAKQLGNKFALELQKEFGVKLIWFFIGRVSSGKYIDGKSDIDMIIIPKDKGMFGYEQIRIILQKMDEYKKYGVVFKKGRNISLIDCMIFFDLKLVNKVREIYNEKNN